MSFELTNLNGEGDEQSIEDGGSQNKSSGVLESVAAFGGHPTTSDGGSSVADERAQILNLKSIAIPIFYYT